MDKDSLKKNMLLKKEKENIDVEKDGDSAIKENDNIQLFRVLAVV